MELPLLLLGAMAVIALSLQWLRRDIKRLPPSPGWELPVIGHLHLLGKLPHQSLQKLAQKHGGLILLKLGVIKTLVVSTPDFAKEILKTNDHVFASRPVGLASKHFGYNGAGLIWATYGEGWRSIRKLCTLQLFTAKQVELSQPVRRSELLLLLKDLLHDAREGNVVELSTKLSDLTFNIILRSVVSRSCSGAVAGDSERQEVIQFKNTILEALMVGGTSAAEFLPWLKPIIDKQMKGLRQFMDAYLDKEILQHRQNLRLEASATPRDFMDVLLSLEEPLPDDSIKAVSLDIIAAGTETTSVTVDWALAELIRCPDFLLRAQEELNNVVGKDRLVAEKDLGSLNYLNAIVKEALRLHPPAPLLIPHESIEPCKIRNYAVPAGTQVLVNAYALGRDPAFWEEPRKFNPDRFMNTSIDVKGQCFKYLPFGSGRRVCPGILLGMTSVQLVLASLIHAFDWRLPNGESASDMNMSEKSGALSVLRASPLKLVPAERLSPNAYA